MAELRVGGLTPLSATDYPGHLSAVVFFQGCPWRCGYCHNPHLLPASAAPSSSWAEVVRFLERRRGLLEAVVLSGGEPAAQPGIVEAAQQVRGMGFRVGLHTAGIYPARLKALLPHLDWVGMDVKAPFDDYDAITGAPGSGEKALECAQAVIASGVAYEFRTTVHPDLLSPSQLTGLAQELVQLGARHYAVQAFRTQGCADTALNARGKETYLTEDFCCPFAAAFESFALRRN